MSDLPTNGGLPPSAPAPDPQPSQPPRPQTPYAFPPPPPLAKRPGMHWMVKLFLILFGMGIFLVLGMGFLVALVGAGAGSGSAKTPFQEKVLVEGGPSKIVLIEVHGAIMEGAASPFAMGPGIVESAVKQLQTASADSNVKAVILSVDSPGGGVTASDVIHHAVQAVRDAGKPVVVHMRDLAASGGYYISAPANTIIASPTTVTGSIGVILSTFNAQTLVEDKLGIKQDNIVSGPHKDILSMTRAMTPEERAILQAIVDDMYKRFVDIVQQGRNGHANFPADRAGVEKIADGRVYTAGQALKLGLVDAIGYRDEAIAEARKLANAPDAQVIQYHRVTGLLSALSAKGGEGGGVNINAGVQIDAAGLGQAGTPRMEYRWAPLR